MDPFAGMIAQADEEATPQNKPTENDEFASMIADGDTSQAPSTVDIGKTPESAMTTGEAGGPLTTEQLLIASQGNIPGIMAKAKTDWGFEDAVLSPKAEDGTEELLLKKDGIWMKTGIKDNDGVPEFDLATSFAQSAVPSIGSAVGGILGSPSVAAAGIAGAMGWGAGTIARRAIGERLGVYEATEKDKSPEDTMNLLKEGAFNEILGLTIGKALSAAKSKAIAGMRKVSDFISRTDPAAQEIIRANPFNYKQVAEKQLDEFQELAEANNAISEEMKQAEKIFNRDMMKINESSLERKETIKKIAEAKKIKTERELIPKLEEEREMFGESLYQTRKKAGKKFGDVTSAILDGPEGNAIIDVNVPHLSLAADGNIVEKPPLFNTIIEEGKRRGFIPNPERPKDFEVLKRRMSKEDISDLNFILDKIRYSDGNSEINKEVSDVISGVKMANEVSQKAREMLLSGKINENGVSTPPTLRDLNNVVKVMDQFIEDRTKVTKTAKGYEEELTPFAAYLSNIRSEINGMIRGPQGSKTLGEANKQFADVAKTIDNAKDTLLSKTSERMVKIIEGHEGVAIDKAVDSLKKVGVSPEGLKYFDSIKQTSKKIQQLNERISQIEAKNKILQKRKVSKYTAASDEEEMINKEAIAANKEKGKLIMKNLELLAKTEPYISDSMVKTATAGIMFWGGLGTIRAAAMFGASPRINRSLVAYEAKQKILSDLIDGKSLFEVKKNLDVIKNTGIPMATAGLDHIAAEVQELVSKKAYNKALMREMAHPLRVMAIDAFNAQEEAEKAGSYLNGEIPKQVIELVNKLKSPRKQ